MTNRLMNRLAKDWLADWIQKRLEAENRHLFAQVEQLKQEVDRLNAYIDGLEKGIRGQKKILLQMGGKE